MDSSPEKIPRTVPYDAFSVIGKCTAPLFVKGSRVRHHHDVCIFWERPFQFQELPGFPLRDNIVRIQPHQIVAGSLLKCEIARCGKVILPDEIVNPVRILRRNLLRPVGRPGIHDDDLVCQTFHARKASPQHFLLISYYHAQTQ